ncbi:MAG: dual specificity protein phosphatase family protein [Desulfobacterium sp.]|nr:dual specificity protein phosphatase family protein [Desulfobacterium sp.]
MPDYDLSWVTPQLAVGRAPMSYAELDHVRAHGINAIINLCAEFSDLHALEEGSGFEVFYLPVWDDEAPDMEEMKEMENGLAWLDEAIYRGKKVLVHCRHGIGRSGTPLTLREPRLEKRNAVDLAPYVDEYETLVRKVTVHVEAASKACGYPFGCGKKHHKCCFEPFEIPLIEAIYLHKKMHQNLARGPRETVMAGTRNLDLELDKNQTTPCPLLQDKDGVLHGFRPVRCRIYGVPQGLIDQHTIHARLNTLSSNVFLALSGRFPGKVPLTFSIATVVSGAFIQEYFQVMARLSNRYRR